MEQVVPKPTNATMLEVHEKKDIKAQRVTLDAVKDHLIPHMAEKTTVHEMFKPLMDLFQGKC